jgi:outer membrane protein OmpA-like peptidoglycan-associated protein
LIAVSREAVQTAEDAREIAVKRIDEVRLANERQAASDAQATSQAQADTANRLKDQAQSDTVIARANAEKAQADLTANQSASAAAISIAQADAEQSRLAAQKAQMNEQQANSDKAAIRAQLSEQLNKILATRESARGLIVSMSDVLFDTGHYTLKPGARGRNWRRLLGFLSLTPDLTLKLVATPTTSAATI